jgi:hypothetical protein
MVLVLSMQLGAEHACECKGLVSLLLVVLY